MTRTPIFVLHGVANRDQAAFERTVAILALHTKTTMHPVYWGDLAANDTWIDKVIPRRTTLTDDRTRDTVNDSDHADLIESLAGTTDIRDDHAPEELLSTIRDRLVENPEWDGDTDEVLTAVIDLWPETHWLARVPASAVHDETARELAAIAIDAQHLHEDPGHATVETRGEWTAAVQSRVSHAVQARLADIDRVVGASMGFVGGRLNQYLRDGIGPGTARFFGDVLVYQRHRERIADRVRATIHDRLPGAGTPDQPLYLLGHSLGGVIAFDLAVSDTPLWTRSLLTCGSQAPFFHVVDGRGGLLDNYTGAAQQLPPTIGEWTNLWEDLDPLAFAANRVFTLHDGQRPADVRTRHLASSGLWTHSSYWQSRELIDTVKAAFPEAVD